MRHADRAGSGHTGCHARSGKARNQPRPHPSFTKRDPAVPPKSPPATQQNKPKSQRAETPTSRRTHDTQGINPQAHFLSLFPGATRYGSRRRTRMGIACGLDRVAFVGALTLPARAPFPGSLIPSWCLRLVGPAEMHFGLSPPRAAAPSISPRDWQVAPCLFYPFCGAK